MVLSAASKKDSTGALKKNYERASTLKCKQCKQYIFHLHLEVKHPSRMIRRVRLQALNLCDSKWANEERKREEEGSIHPVRTSVYRSMNLLRVFILTVLRQG